MQCMSCQEELSTYDVEVGRCSYCGNTRLDAGPAAPANQPRELSTRFRILLNAATVVAVCLGLGAVTLAYRPQKAASATIRYPGLRNVLPIPVANYFGTRFPTPVFFFQMQLTKSHAAFEEATGTKVSFQDYSEAVKSLAVETPECPSFKQLLELATPQAIQARLR